MYIGFDSVVASNTVQTASAFTVPGNATHVEVQASVQDVHYTMDAVTSPTTSVGMVFATAHEPKLFSIEDFNRIKFVRATAADGVLNAHFVAGRDI